MGKNIYICGKSLLVKKWIPFYKLSHRPLTNNEKYLLIECWNYAIDSGITEVKSVMRCVHHFILMFSDDYEYPMNDLVLYSEVIVGIVHSIIGQNKEDELEIFGKPSEIFKYQMKILEYPVHKFLMYLDFHNSVDIHYEKEIQDIQFFYLLQTGEDKFPKNLLKKVHRNYANEMMRVFRRKEEMEYIVDEEYEITF